jgi:hypothetical protein
MNLQTRFWPDGSDFQTVNTNGLDGQSKIVDGSSCTGNDSAQWILQGVPAGTYEIQVFIPQYPGLTTSAHYGDTNTNVTTVNQSAEAGQWVTVAQSQAFQPGYYGYVTAMTAAGLDCGGSQGVLIFDAARFILESYNDAGGIS